MGFSKLTKFYVVNVCFMDDCVGGSGGGGGRKEWERSGVGRCFVLVFARMRPCDLIEYKKVAFFKLLFVYLGNLGVLKNSFKCAFLHGIRICWFLTTEGKTVVRGAKPLGARERTNNNLNLNMVFWQRFEPGRHN